MPADTDLNNWWIPKSSKETKYFDTFYFLSSEHISETNCIYNVYSNPALHCKIIYWLYIHLKKYLTCICLKIIYCLYICTSVSVHGCAFSPSLLAILSQIINHSGKYMRTCVFTFKFQMYLPVKSRSCLCILPPLNPTLLPDLLTRTSQVLTRTLLGWSSDKHIWHATLWETCKSSAICI